MEDNALYLIAADAILFVHAAFVAFVVFGLVLILAETMISTRKSKWWSKLKVFAS